MKQKIIATIVILGLLLTTVERTFAGLSDTETGTDNYYETGSLDLKAARVNASWEGATFRDDLPYGAGLEPAFNETSARPGASYESRYILWNSGSIDGEVYLRIRVDRDPEGIAGRSCLIVWYDDNGDKLENMSEVANGTLAAFGGTRLDLGMLPAAQLRRLKFSLRPLEPDFRCEPGETAPFLLDFKTEFQLLQANARGFTDTEFSGSLVVGILPEAGGSPGFWWGSGALQEYGKCLLASEFRTIVRHSNWFVDIPLADNDDADYQTMLGILADTGDGNTYPEVVGRFRRQYLALRLNAAMVPPRLRSDNSHRLDEMPGAAAFFGYGEGSLATIIATIENACYDGSIMNPPPATVQMEILKEVCAALNEVRI